MLTLLLMVLAVAGIHSLPLQENCTETERTFHECLRKLYPEIIHSKDMDGFKSQKAAFLQCGAKHSDCYLQKTLMTMIDYLTDEKHNESYVGSSDCHNNQAYEQAEQKCYDWPYNEHGFKVPFHESFVRIYKCLGNVAKSHSCPPEYIEELLHVENRFLREQYENRLSKFFMFVKMNAALDKNTPIVLSEPLRQPKHCKQSEKVFQACMKDKTSTNNTENRAAYIQCGADKSECYLQRHLMKMVNTVINITEEPYEYIQEEFVKCGPEIEKMNSIGLECLRSGFDEHGFPKPDQEFAFHEERCIAHMAERSEACSSNVVNMYKHFAIGKYEYALSDFSKYVNDAKRTE